MVVVWSPGDMDGFGDPNVPPGERLESIADALLARSVQVGWDVIRDLLGTQGDRT